MRPAQTWWIRGGDTGPRVGPGSTAKFFCPSDVTLDAKGTLYISDLYCGKIRSVVNTLVSTLAGGSGYGYLDGPAALAKFNYPEGVAASGGIVYVADGKNNRVRRISGGKVNTTAGAGNNGFKDGPVDKALFNYPSGLAVGGTGKIYVADSANHRVRLITP